jgi:hypothetical protein
MRYVVLVLATVAFATPALAAGTGGGGTAGSGGTGGSTAATPPAASQSSPAPQRHVGTNLPRNARQATGGTPKYVTAPEQHPAHPVNQ